MTHGPELEAALRSVEPRVHLLAASVLIDAGALDAAWEPISAVADAADDPRLRAEVTLSLLRLASGWTRREQRRRADGALRLAARLTPEQGVPALARHLHREGRLEEASELWAEAVRLDVGEADHHLRHGHLLERLGRFEEAHAAYLRLVEELPTTSNALTVAPRLDRVAARLTAPPETGVKIALLGSATLDQLRDCLIVLAHGAGLRPEVHAGRPDRYRVDLLDPDSGLHRFAPDVLILAIHRSRLFPALEAPLGRLPDDECRQAIRSGLDEVRTMLGAFRRYSNALVLLHNMVVPQHPGQDRVIAATGARHGELVHRVNLGLAEVVATEFVDVHLIDEDALQAQCGKRVATDPRLWLAAGIPWSDALLMPLAHEHLCHLTAHRGVVGPGVRAARWTRRGGSGRLVGGIGGDIALEDRVRAIVADTFDLDDDELPGPASRETVQRWTSQTHATLVLNLEQRFGISFSLEQILAMTSERTICEVLRQLS